MLPKIYEDEKVVIRMEYDTDDCLRLFVFRKANGVESKTEATSLRLKAAYKRTLLNKC
jgi:hypothetical protein